jgi:hypothetical protein
VDESAINECGFIRTGDVVRHGSNCLETIAVVHELFWQIEICIAANRNLLVSALNQICISIQVKCVGGKMSMANCQIGLNGVPLTC